MAAKNPTNRELQSHIEKYVDKKVGEMKDYIDTKISPLHDYMVGQQALAKYKSPQSLSTKDLMNFIIKIMTIVAGIIASIVGINKIT